VDTSTPGEYLVTYNVTDAAGNAATTVTRAVTVPLPVPDEATVTVAGDIKTLNFSWSEPEYVDYFRLLENADGHSGFTQVGEDIPAGTMNVSRDIAVHLFDWVNAQYIIEACNVMGCSSSDVVTATDVMLDTIGYFKASNTGIGDSFGWEVALSADGTTLAVGTSWEDSSATGINGDQADDSARFSGAVYLFRFDGMSWAQQAYIKASNTEDVDLFGAKVALSADGNTLAVGAPFEDSSATGINGDQADNSADGAGAVYLFRFDGASWAQQAYIKASNTEAQNGFGSVALSADGDTLAVGAAGEDSSATGINGDQADNSADGAGAVYLFRFDGTSWAQQAYVKASNTESADSFGGQVALSADGDTLAVGASGEWSSATGINGDQADNSLIDAGAVYVFRFDGMLWAQQAYIKASNTGSIEFFGRPAGQFFGSAVSLSADGMTLAAGARGRPSYWDDSISIPSSSAFVFRFDGVDWFEQAHLTASNTRGGDEFGAAVSLSADGKSLAVGAPGEDGAAVGVNGDENALAGICDGNADTRGAGAVYIFRFEDTEWNQDAYVKALEHVGAGTHHKDCRNDNFGGTVAISADGKTLAVGAYSEDSDGKGIGSDHLNNLTLRAGAVYVY
jgi:hypothetical protein